MAVVHNPEGEYSKELDKWNIPKSQGGMRCDGYEHFPLMLYKAQKHPKSGQWAVEDLGDESFSRGCTLTVFDQDELVRAKNSGWVEGMAAALEAGHVSDHALAVAAAERNYQDRARGELAQREIQAAEAETHEQLGEIPRTAVKPRGRPRKTPATQ